MEQSLICGVDEAGRGALAGPVVAGAVIYRDHSIDGLNDSKKLSDTRRRKLLSAIHEHALAYAVGVASAEEIDKYNIREATKLAFQRALAQIEFPDTEVPILIDGDFVPPLDRPAQAVIGGDRRYPAIMAASILAKVTRDDRLIELDAQCPDYGFKQHKGYGTAAHLNAISAHGPCSEHRMSFAPLSAK